MSAKIMQENESNLVIVKLPGAVLRQARERKGMSVAAVAQSLRLDISVIEALERDEYAKLPGAAYICGYLRGYARLLNMAPEPLITEFQRINGEEAPAQYLKHTSLKEKIDTGHSHNGRKAILLGLAAVIVLAVLWWQPWTLVSMPGEKASNSQEAAEATATAEQSNSDQQLVLPATNAPDTTSVGPATGTAPATELQPLTTTQPENVVTIATQAPVTSEISSLSLSASDDSWVQVKDGKGKRLVYEILKGGTQKSVQGVAPFDVLLGNGRNVSVQIDGHVFDHTSYISGPTSRAHFKVGSGAANE